VLVVTFCNRPVTEPLSRRSCRLFPPEGQLLIYQDGALCVQVRIDGRTVWLTQRLMAELYQI